MKTLDRYVVRNFLFTALMCFIIIMSLRVIVDLLWNVEEFTRQIKPSESLVRTIITYYGYQSFVYLTELGGVMIVASAAFTLAMMNHSNELTAMMASGVSLRRVSLPIILLSIAMSSLIVIDEEYIIPRIASHLVRDKDNVDGTDGFQVRLITDGAGTPFFAQNYNPLTGVMDRPLIIPRDGARPMSWLTGFPYTDGRAWSATLDGKSGWAMRPAMLGRIGREAALARDIPTTSEIWTTNIDNPDARAYAASQPASPGIGPQTILEDAQIVTWNKGGGAVPLTQLDPKEAVELGDDAMGVTLTAARFEADKYQPGQPRGGRLVNPRFEFRDRGGAVQGIFSAAFATWSQATGDDADRGCWKLDEATSQLFLPSDLTGNDLVLRQSSHWLEYMSSSQLRDLLRLSRVPDRNAARLVQQVRLTEPLNHLIMLLLGLPFVLSRERNIKASAGLCLGIVATFYVFVYVCRYMGFTPVEWCAWLPSLLFGPVAVVMYDSVKT